MRVLCRMAARCGGKTGEEFRRPACKVTLGDACVLHSRRAFGSLRNCEIFVVHECEGCFVPCVPMDAVFELNLLKNLLPLGSRLAFPPTLPEKPRESLQNSLKCPILESATRNFHPTNTRWTRLIVFVFLLTPMLHTAEACSTCDTNTIHHRAVCYANAGSFQIGCSRIPPSLQC